MYWNTVTPTLQEILREVMASPIFNSFRLVGGTALSLQLGHRVSIDIDLFTDADYDTIDFELIGQFFHQKFQYADPGDSDLTIGMGKFWYVGKNKEDAVKVDIFYTEPYIRAEHFEEQIRFANKEDIIPMKLEVIGNGGRKKDFWDIHALQDSYTVKQMIDLYLERYPYNYSAREIHAALTDFKKAENDFDPTCLWGKNWELIKLEISKWADRYKM